MKIGVDAGHGLHTAGKRCAKQFDANETREWVLNSRVATKVCEILNRSGVETLRLDDTTGNTDVSLSTRCTNANNANVDLVVSIHHNAGGGTGIETYVYNETLKNGETGRIATLVNNKAVEKTGMRNRGVKTKDLAIIRDTKMKACLIECGFMDNEFDTPLILTEEYANKVASGIAEGILTYYNIENTSDQNNSKKIDVKYQAYADGKWYPDVINTNDHAGTKGEAISGFRGNTVGKEEVVGKLIYCVGLLNDRWLGEITDREKDKSGDNFAGILGKPIDRIMIKCTKRQAKYRVRLLNGEWLPWVFGYNKEDKENGYAGIKGKMIDAIQVEIV
ncbi:MAG: N-acetylmuramoyl-L-alanine amidase [Clostridia bacterium]|nr:N-acetylmuramoyl-L-alanine amidase [Clostridia bacterium]